MMARGPATEEVDMPGRRISMIAALSAVMALAACGDGAEKSKSLQTPEERIAAALDPCAEGRRAYAQSLCENASIASLDQEVRQALAAESASVSDAGGQLLVQNEQRWREAQRVACGVFDPDAAATDEQRTCLESLFRARVQEAQRAVEQVGGYTFQRVELIDAQRVSSQVARASGLGEEAPAAVMRDIRFPRIDGPQTPQIQRFNELMAQQPQYRLEDATEEVVDYQIAYAGAEVVSVRFNMSEYALGAAHPNNSAKAVTVLMATGEPITTETVFRAGSGWQNFVTQRAVQEITRQFRDYGFTPPVRDVRESATKPHLWLITETGLVILFPPYSFGGSHVMGGTEVAIDWADLRPYLNSNAPAPIRPAA
jgi:hypothetical protein